MGWAAICAVASGVMVILLFVIYPNVHFSTESDLPSAAAAGVVFLVMLAIVLAMFAVLFMVSLYETSRHLENFDAYKKEVEDKWGPIE